MSSNWNKFYENHRTGMYQDRHWLWQIFPELFPLPPGREYKECYCHTLCCCKCGTKQLDQVESCPHVPVYKSLFADQFAGSKQTKGIEVPFPPRDFSRQEINVLEIGCGVGNTVFPLLEKNAEVRVTCGDFSEEAIQILKIRPRYDEKVIKARVLDALNVDADLKG